MPSASLFKETGRQEIVLYVHYCQLEKNISIQSPLSCATCCQFAKIEVAGKKCFYDRQLCSQEIIASLELGRERERERSFSCVRMMNQHLGVTQESHAQKKSKGWCRWRALESRDSLRRSLMISYMCLMRWTPLVLVTLITLQIRPLGDLSYIFNAVARSLLQQKAAQWHWDVKCVCGWATKGPKVHERAAALIFLHTPHILILEHPPLQHSDFYLCGASGNKKMRLAGDNFVSAERDTWIFLSEPGEHRFLLLAVCISMRCIMYMYGAFACAGIKVRQMPALRCRRCRRVILFGKTESKMCKYFALFHPVPPLFIAITVYGAAF